MVVKKRKLFFSILGLKNTFLVFVYQSGFTMCNVSVPGLGTAMSGHVLYVKSRLSATVSIRWKRVGVRAFMLVC